MNAWTSEELDRVGSDAAQRADTARLHAGRVERDVRHAEPQESVDDLVDDAYRTKYARYPDSYTRT
jgi:hypothetical protein